MIPLDRAVWILTYPHDPRSGRGGAWNKRLHRASTRFGRCSVEALKRMARVTPLTPPPNVPVELDDRRTLVFGARIGRGSRAAVFHGMVEGAAGVRRQVAVKLFDVVASDERDVVVPRIGRAIRHAATVRHPNVVAAYEFGVHGGRQPFALSELVDGRSLADLLEAFEAKGQRLPPDLALFIGLEVAEALTGARGLGHGSANAGLVHGDLSARDVLLSWHGEVKVTDFGISAAVGAASAVRSRVSIARRVVTLAPEVAQGDKADARADVFSLGALLHVMLLGPRFSPEIADEEILTRAVAGSFEPKLFGPRLPPEILDLIERATHADPERRLDDPAIVAYELRRAAMALGVGDGRVFLRHAMQSMFGSDTSVEVDGPTAPTRPTARPPALSRRGG
jgi:serine/threonine protein kinase